MKLTNKILLVTGVVLMATLTVLLIRFKGLVDGVKEYRSGVKGQDFADMVNSAIISQEFSITDFDEINIECNAKVRIKNSDQYRIIAEAPGELINSAALKIKKEGSTLEISCPPLKPNLIENKINIAIAMPAIKKLDINEFTAVKIDSFEIEKLAIQLAGKSEVIGQNNRIENLKINCFGSADADFQTSRVKNATIQAFGSNDITLTMTGGRLAGSMTGSGELNYYGEVEQVDVKTVGATKVIKKN